MSAHKYKSKTAFRKSDEWQKFREHLLQTHKRCACCGRKNKLTVHHKHEGLAAPDYYDISDETQFYVLCQSCHRFLHSSLAAIKANKSKAHHQALEDFVYSWVFDDRVVPDSQILEPQPVS